jgi:hypothetical protein
MKTLLKSSLPFLLALAGGRVLTWRNIQPGDDL